MIAGGTETASTTMAEFYPEIRLVHITAALASGALFFVRGVLSFAGIRAVAAALRYLAYTFDTVFLTAALMLMTIVHQYPFVHHWLTMKLVLLAIYIALGVMTFRSTGGAAPFRIGSLIGALAVFGAIYSVARAHDPLGLFSR